MSRPYVSQYILQLKEDIRELESDLGVVDSYVTHELIKREVKRLNKKISKLERELER